MSFRCIKAFMHAFSGRFSRTCLEGISFNFFVCFIFNVSLGSAPKRKNFDIQRNTRVGSGGQFTSNRLSNDHIVIFVENVFNTWLSNEHKQITCGTQAVAAERMRWRDPMVRKPRLLKSPSLRWGMWRTSTSSSTNLSMWLARP